MANRPSSKPFSAREMIDEVGIEAVCQAFGKSESTVRGWRSRRVPKAYKDQLESMVEEKRQAPIKDDKAADEIDAFTDALDSIGDEVALFSQSPAPASEAPLSDHQDETPANNPVDLPAMRDDLPTQDEGREDEVVNETALSAREQRRQRRARRQKETRSAGQASPAAGASHHPFVDRAEEGEAPPVTPAAIEHTKKPVRLNRQTVIIAGAVLVAATGIGLSQGLQSAANGPAELSTEETKQPIASQASVILPNFDYAAVTRPAEPPELESAALTAPAEPPKEEQPAPPPPSPIVSTSQTIAPAPRRDTESDEEEEAALQSGLFPSGASASRSTVTPAAAGGSESQDATLAALDSVRQSLGAAQGALLQGQNQTGGQEDSFLTAQLDDSIYLKNGLHKPISAFEVKAGTIIPAALITGLNSDLPGEVIGQVTEHVYDTATGQHLLLPQGAKILGRYNSEVGYAQERAQVVWDRLIMPNGNSIQLEAMVGTDKAGYAGLADQVDHHFGQLLGAVILSSFISVGANLATDSGDDVTDALGDAAAQQAAQVGGQIVDRQLSVQPTITVRPGFKLNILVNKDMILEPYQAR